MNRPYKEPTDGPHRLLFVRGDVGAGLVPALAARYARTLAGPLSPFLTQYRGLARDAGAQCLVFCPVGQFIEFYGPQRLLAMPALGLRPASLPRGGYALTVGFPARLFGIYRTRALRQGLAVLEVWQGPEMLTARCRERRPARLFLPTVAESDR